jgi:hypothetical protein
MGDAALSQAGSLVVHTQKIFFALDWSACDREVFPSNAEKLGLSVVFRTEKQSFAGFIRLNKSITEQLHVIDQSHATLITVSTCHQGWKIDLHTWLGLYVTKHHRDMSIGGLCGCPCFLDDDIANHIIDCPEHAEFPHISPVRMFSEDCFDSLSDTKDKYGLVYAHHLKTQSYYDANGGLLHREEHPPVLWVTMIAAKKENGVDSKVYQRVRIGQVYLKQWVAADPVFQLIVLD